jgi:FAD/FMN-containing dehydrogenase
MVTKITRRRFLSQVAGTALLPLLPTAQIDARQAKHGSPVYYRGTPEYQESRSFFNKAIDELPALVARPRTEAELVETLYWADEHGLSLAVRGGGHGGGSSAVRDNALLIDTRTMSNVSVDPPNGAATVMAGTLLEQVDRATEVHGLVAITGNCPSVGVAGFILGGGNSCISRRYGLACDSLISARAVTPSGKTLRASADENEDLFWALRGAGGGNFAIVTEMKIRTHKVQHVYGGALVWDFTQASEVLSRYQDYVLTGPEHFGGALRVKADSDGGNVALFGLSCADSADDAERTWDYIRSWGAPRQDSIAIKTFAGFHAESGAFIPSSVNYSRRNGFLAAPLNTSAIESLLASLVELRRIRMSVTFEPFNGAIHSVQPKATSFIHRDAQLLYSAFAVWTNESERARTLEALSALHSTMQPYLSGFAYQNYDDRIVDDSPALRQRIYYADSLPRLRELKKRLDPGDLLGGLIRPSS